MTSSAGLVAISGVNADALVFSEAKYQPIQAELHTRQLSSVEQLQAFYASQGQVEQLSSTVQTNADTTTATFQRIGLAGGQTGIVKTDIDGITVQNSLINCITQIMANGLRMGDARKASLRPECSAPY